MAYQALEMEGLTTERTEAQKRAEVFLKVTAPRVILIKVLAMGPIAGVPRVALNKGDPDKDGNEKDRDDTGIEIKHIAEAESLGLDPFAYRDRADTGLCLFQKEQNVRVDELLGEMWQMGYVLKDYHWQNQNKKGPVNTFEFILPLDGEEIAPVKLSDAARRTLYMFCFNHCTIWCNLKKDKHGEYRLDTINLAKGRETDEPSRQVQVVGNVMTYRLY